MNNSVSIWHRGKYRFAKRFLIALIFVLVISGLLNIALPIFKTRAQFKAMPSPLSATYDLHDLGVVDANKDGYLDVFTLNHSARQNLLLGSDTGLFRDVLSQWNLDQDREVAGLEDTDRAPNIEQPGLYVFRQNFDLHFKITPDAGQTMRGRLSLALPVEVVSQTNFEVTVSDEVLDGVSFTKVNFSGEPGGELILKGFPEIPHRISIDKTVSLDNVFIGLRKINPDSHDLVLMWRDRHSMAWADLNGDRRLELFVGRGGIRGKLRELSEPIEDELFLFDQTQFRDVAQEKGLEKEGCPGRQSAWVDENGDGLLDLYLMCGRGVTDAVVYPNQLYRQQPDGSFSNVAPQLGLDLPAAGTFVWADVNHDGQMDLVASQDKSLSLYVNEGNQFTSYSVGDHFDDVIIQLALADVDADQDLDIYVVTYGQAKNKLLINVDGRYEIEDPSIVGLPDVGFNAVWVDYDNDGLIDLHMLPAGMYKHQKNHRYHETPLLTQPWPLVETWNGRAVWFDYDNNGTRDLLLAYQQTPSLLQPQPNLKTRLQNQFLKRDTSRIWQSVFYRNLKNANHWLSIRLQGQKGNLSSIGAQVSVKANQLNQFQQVGMSESSHFSQGHYQLYFGLGDATEAEVQVKWPDGTVQTATVPVDQILDLSYPL